MSLSTSSNSPFYKGTPIRQRTSLAAALGYTLHRIEYVAPRANKLYRLAHAELKSDGTIRQTFDAQPLLKDIHRRIKTEILDRVTFPNYLTGSLKGRDYKSNAELHEGAAIVIAEDIENFFPNTTSDKVFDIWRHFFRFSEPVAQLLTSLTTKDGALPQGAITSPQLANLVFWRDEPLLQAKLAADDITYSRFVDDVTVSSVVPIPAEKKTELVRAIYGLLRRNGLQPKRVKHELKTRRERMTVTKLTVNDKAGLPAKERSRIRAAVHRLELKGAQQLLEAGELASVLGKVHHMARFHPGEAKPLKARLLKISARGCAATPSEQSPLPPCLEP